MEVTCDVVGGETRTVEVAADATYADLLGAIGLSAQEATAVVGGDPVPADAAVTADRVQVLRLVRGGAGPTVAVRLARPGERPTARALVDRAMLTVPEDPTWVVAVEGDDPPRRSGTVVGSLALVGCEVAAVAVRRDRRGGGVGRALVAAAGERCDHLTARFRPAVRGFYESLGFTVEPTDSGRLRGVR